ncbi:hypothetical protein ACJJTC_002084 [Scirpophaga incertulas]
MRSQVMQPTATQAQCNIVHTSTSKCKPNMCGRDDAYEDNAGQLSQSVAPPAPQATSSNIKQICTQEVCVSPTNAISTPVLTDMIKAITDSASATRALVCQDDGSTATLIDSVVAEKIVVTGPTDIIKINAKKRHFEIRNFEHEIDDCEKHCSTGIFYKHTAIQSYFEGSACAILSGIHTKLTACFSAGNLGSEVKVFSRLSTDSGLDFKVIKHSHGIDLASDLRIDDNGTILASEPSRDSSIWPVMVAVRGGDRFCSYDLVDLTKTCHSSDLHDPLKMDSSCLQPVPHWNPDTKRYELSYKNNDFEDMVHVNFEQCPSDMLINIEEYKLKVGIIVNAVTATFQFRRFESGSSIALCNSKPNIRVEKGILGYHQSTVLILKSTNTYRCSVHVTIEGCESTQGQLFTLKPSAEFITDYWCANNSTGVVAITWNKGSSKVTKDVAKNILPHIQQLENLLASTYSDSVAVFDFSTVLNILERLNPVGFLTSLYDYFHLNWTKIGASLLSAILLYRSVVTFDLPLMVFSVFTMFLSLATNVMACNSYNENTGPSLFKTLELYIRHLVDNAHNLIGFRPDIVEDVILNTTFKMIEQAQETAAIIKPKTALSVVKSADWAAWLFSVIVISGIYGHLAAVILVIIYKVAVRILCLVNFDRTKQDVLIVIPGLPWVGQLIYRSLNYNRTSIFVAKRKLNLKEAILEMSAPVNCANSTISFDIKELVEGNNKPYRDLETHAY